MTERSTHEDPWLLVRTLYMKDLNEEEQGIFGTASPENLLDSTNAAQKSYEEQSRARSISRKLEPFINAIDQFGEALDVDDVKVSLGFLCKRLWKSFNDDFQENILRSFRKGIENMEKEVMISHMIETSQDRALLRREKEEAERQDRVDELSTESGREDVTIPRFASEDVIMKDIRSQQIGLIYYYCDFSDPRSLELRNILGAIIRQLLEEINMSTNLEQQITKACGQISEAVMNDNLSAILFQVFECFPKVFLFIDGLDECKFEVQTAILSLLHELSQFSQPKVKIFVASRDEHTISKSLEDFPQLRVGAEHNSGDINYFIEETVKRKMESRLLMIRDVSLKSEIINTLTSQAHGMFLWVHFQIADLCETDSDHGIRHALQNLPKGMAETYARAVRKIARNPLRATRAQQIFKWIASAKRPLLIAELAEAVAFNRTDQFWDSSKIPHTENLIQGCGNLVVLDDDGTARFVHHTVQQFLIVSAPESSLPDFHFQASEADLEAGQTCMTYLMFSDFEKQITIPEPHCAERISRFPSPKAITASIIPGRGLWSAISSVESIWRYLSPRKTQPHSLTLEMDLAQFVQLRKPPNPDMSKRYQFLSYAIENWLNHTTEITEKEICWNKFRSLATDRSSSFDIRPWGNPSGPNSLPHVNLFRWAIQDGHTGLLRLLMQLPKANIQDYCLRLGDEGFSILMHAAVRGHENMIKFLLSQDCIDSMDEKALLQLGQSGNASAVRLILELELCDHEEAAALCIGTSKLQPDVIRAVLENGPPLNLHRGWGKIMLEHAVKARSDIMLSILLDKTADFERTMAQISAIWGGDFNLLCAFAKQGLTRTIQRVLERGKVDVDAKDTKHKQTALCWAAEYGHEAIVELLLEMVHADVDSKDACGRTPLFFAADAGEGDIVRLLLDIGGADVGLKDITGSTSLHYAAEAGHTAIVQLLLDKGKVHVDSKDSNERTPLHLAAGAGHKGVVQSLLHPTHNAESDPKDSAGRTPLSLAAQHGHATAMELLLDTRKVDVNSRDITGRTPLSWAAAFGRDTSMELLLGTDGVDVDSKDLTGRTPLLWTVLNYPKDEGPVQQLQLLLKTGEVNINAVDENGDTPLSLAKRREDDTLGKMLQLYSDQEVGRSETTWLHV
ncbi:MAG: hypothetical protein Q9165_001049 [Trypethelium subeluteriae]